MTNAAEPPCTLSTFRNLLRALVPREVLWRAEWGLPRSAVDRFVNAEYRRSNWFCREFETRPLIRDREISMPKNIVLCCDGTANEFAQDRTNVVKLYFTLDPDPARQVTYYHPGLGAMEPPGALSGATRLFTRLAGRAFGYGLEGDIRDAYVFLMSNFSEGDRVFLFGFSRGAYTARAMASLLRMYGLIPRGNDALVPYAVRLLMGTHAIDSRGRNRCAEEKRYFNLAADFKSTFATRI